MGLRGERGCCGAAWRRNPVEVECEVEAVGRQLVGGRGIGRWVGCRR